LNVSPFSVDFSSDSRDQLCPAGPSRYSLSAPKMTSDS
jgi:hypothetical protein